MKAKLQRGYFVSPAMRLSGLAFTGLAFRYLLSLMLLIPWTAQAMNFSASGTEVKCLVDKSSQALAPVEFAVDRIASVPSANEILKASLLASMSYESDGTIESVIHQLGYNRLKVFSRSAQILSTSKSLKGTRLKIILAHTRAFWIENEQSIVILFGGTDTKDWLSMASDIFFERQELGHLGSVHAGFLSALKIVWRDLVLEIQNAQAKPVFFIGHSLGGALAILASTKMLDEESHARTRSWSHPYVGGVYTFGAPKVGDLTFRNSALRLFGQPPPIDISGKITPLASLHQIANPNDIVTYMPLSQNYLPIGSAYDLELPVWQNEINEQSSALAIWRLMKGIFIDGSLDLSPHWSTTYAEEAYKNSFGENSGCR